MPEQNYDVIIIGSGPGGEGAAMKIAKVGKKVAVVERYLQIGGGCTHWGTIPSKALREAVRKYTEFRNNPLFSEAVKGLNFTYPQLLHSAQQVIANQVALRSGFYERNHVEIIEGQAQFVDMNTLHLQRDDELPMVLKADAFVIATGSHPYHPTDVDFSHPRILDSDTILELDQTPPSLTIYGAGVVGCEYASLFRNLGAKVNLINTRDKLLAFLDDEIIDALSYHLRDQGILIRHNEHYEKVVAADDGVVLHLKSGKKVKTDYLLWANGRTGNIVDLGLDTIEIDLNHRQQIKVNDNYQTSLEHIYAVGDVIGYPGLASAAYDQGRFAAQHIISGESEYRLVQHIPTGIYTNPEISSVGYTERELTEKKVPYEVGHSLFRHLARAQIVGSKVGMLKLLFHRETREILGVHCFGHQAAEIIHIGQAIMSQKEGDNSLMYFVNTTFNYPTMAEAYRVAALNGLNRLF